MYNFTKRAVDVAFAVTFLVIALPVFVATMLLLSITGDREVFYLQERIGYKNRRFFIIKFATMYKNGNYHGVGQFTVANDPRITPLGRILRKTKLNELPQLLNILKGDMTLVGPRPLTKDGFYRYSAEIQQRIYNVRPGLTGVGSIVFRDEVKYLKNCTDLEALYKRINAHKGKLEIWYQQHRSLKVDFQIICLTAYSILVPDQDLIYRTFKSLPHISEMEEMILNVTKMPEKKPVVKSTTMVSNKVEFGM